MPVEIIEGDCREVLRELAEQSVDLTVTSPPYDNMRSYNGNNEGWGEHVWRDVLVQLYRVTKPGGVVVWVVGDATVDGSETGTSFKQALCAMECGFNLHDTMIYKKANPGIAGSNYCYLSVFEYMFVFSRGRPRTTNFLRDRKNVRSGKTTAGATRRSVEGETAPTRQFEQAEFGKRFNIWEYPTGGTDLGHPAPFPLGLARDHILSWSKDGDTVLDPFFGAGTTGLACQEVGNRECMGIEMDPKYYDIAVKRLGLDAEAT
jgi:site-specific DNA-methyltransferase (adenine-specific)